MPLRRAQAAGAASLIDRVLPDELMITVFRILDVVTRVRCASVSRRWRRLAFDGSLWERVDLFPFQAAITVRSLLLAVRGRGWRRARR